MGIGWSLHKDDGWRGQMDRMHRWHERVIQAANSGSPDLEDFIFVFFQNCYHLGEWLLKTSNVDRTDMEALFDGTPQLRICRDICNGTKHLTLNSASVDADFSIFGAKGSDKFCNFRNMLEMNNIQKEFLESKRRKRRRSPPSFPSFPSVQKKSVSSCHPW